MRLFCSGVLIGISILLSAAGASADTARPVTWKECVSAAMLKNPDLSSAREKSVQADAAAGITRAELLPTVTATASGARSSSETAVGHKTGNTYSYGVEGRQLIFDGLKSVYDYKGSLLTAEAAKFDYMTASATVRYNLRVAYIKCIKARESLYLAGEIARIRKRNFDLVKVKFESGSEHKGAFLSAKADYSQALADITSAERELSLSKTRLCSVMGIPDDQTIVVQGSLDFTGSCDSSPPFFNLAENHPLVVKARMTKDAALYGVRSSQLAFSPSIYGTGSYGRQGDSVSSLKDNWSVGVEVSAPLVEGGSRIYAVKKAEAALRQSQADELSLKRSVSVSLEQSWNDLRDAVSAASVQSEYLKAQSEREKIAEAQYSIGRMTFDSWTVIESAFVQSRQSYLSAAASVLTAEAQWIQSTGGSLDNETQN